MLVEFIEKGYDLEKLKPYEDFLIECSTKDYSNNTTQDHHILPRCMEGSDNKINLITLSLEDHFNAHLKLSECFDNGTDAKRKNMASCRFIRTHIKRNMKKLNRDVPDEIVEFWRVADEIMKDFNKGENNTFFGKKHSEESRKRISETGIGRVPWNKGLTKETNEIVMQYSLAISGENHWTNFKPVSEESKQKRSESTKGEKSCMFGVPKSTEQIAKLVETRKRLFEEGLLQTNKGKKFSKEACEKMAVPKIRIMCEIEGKIFNSLVEAAQFYNVAEGVVSWRLKQTTERWKEWKFLYKHQNGIPCS